MNIFEWIYYIDITLLAILYLIGFLSIEKEFKDVWNGENTMEMKKSERLHYQWQKKHPILDWVQDFYYDTNRFFERFQDWYYESKWFIQRGKNGYSRCDVWGLNYYLADVISNSVKELKDMVHGVPIDLAEKYKEADKDLNKSIKEWKRILGEIEWTFTTAHKINESDWIMVDNESSRERIEEVFKNEKNRHVMTKAECKRYKNGWKLFQKYFFNLWD